MNYKTTGLSNYSIYLHIPFCTHRCGYCDFNTYAGLEALMPAYVDALVAEARQLAASAGERLPVHTIFFGGGTPSLLPVEAVKQILDVLRIAYSVSDDVEITLEANPGTLNQERLAGLHQAGANRLSLGVQSANPEELRLLERQHDFEDVIQAVMWARQAGFDNLNLDWIYGLPGQSLETWQRNIELAIDLNPEHLSLYALSIEHGTPFKEMSSRGLLPAMNADLAADMYEWASSRLEIAGYQQYEISNWAKAGMGGQPLACRHNLQYWRSLPALGLGAGAHGFAGDFRTANVLAPAAYIKRMKEGDDFEFPRTPATVTIEKVDERRAMGDMMMGLRLVDEGVPNHVFADKFGRDLDEVYGPQIDRLRDLGLLELANGFQKNAIRLTKRGRLLGNQVFIEFI
ncbi:MAG: radical SAM family heme chaperone HemW [Chloroflexi bacterium]|nr:radical SAM family heme chaperone HemW [Chloroflexota bacterium]